MFPIFEWKRDIKYKNENFILLFDQKILKFITETLKKMSNIEKQRDIKTLIIFLIYWPLKIEFDIMSMLEIKPLITMSIFSMLQC